MSSTRSTVVGDDDENAWNDRHFQHCYLWLTTNPSSPYCGAPAMLFTALRIDRAYWGDFRRAFSQARMQRYRFSVRVTLTRAFQRVLAGEYIPVIVKRNKLNRVTHYKVLPNPHPQALPCPAFFRGSISITTKGLKLALKRTDASLTPYHNPEGAARLMAPFKAC